MLLTTQQDLETLQLTLQTLSNYEPVAVDTETNWTDRYQDRYCMGIAISFREMDYYIPVQHNSWMDPNGKNLQVPNDFLKYIKGPLVFHNAKFDLHVLKRLGLEVPTNNIYDTMLMAHAINEERLSFSLERIASEELGEHKELALSRILKNDWDSTAGWVMARYACQDTRLTLDLYNALKGDPFGPYERIWTVDREFLLLLQELEAKGVPIDLDRTDKVQRACFDRLRSIEQELGFDPAKSSKLHERLFSEVPYGLGLQVTRKTPTGKPKVDSVFLEQCNHPIAGLLLEWRRLQKQLTSYYTPYLQLASGTSKIHASYKQHGTVTGRMSCADPNMQQIPRDSPIKGLFLSDQGKQLWEIDFRNIEMRLAAVVSRQKSLLELFRNEGDAHELTARIIGRDRQTAKTVNFLTIYGGGSQAIQRTLRLSAEESSELIAKLKAGYPDLFNCARNAAAFARHHSYIPRWTGARRHFEWSHAFNKAFNSIIQGGSFDIVKYAMLRCNKAGVDMRSQVHDSVWVMVDNKQEVEEIEHIMSDWTEKAFGLKFSVESKRLN